MPTIEPRALQQINIERLHTPIWVYDVLNYRIYWANTAALELWEAKSLEELTARDFRPGSSEAVQQTLLSYLREFEDAKVIDRWWQISPNNRDKRVHCRFSGVYTEPGHMAMLIEGLHSDLLEEGDAVYGAVMLCLFDQEGNICSANPPFIQQFGESLSNLSQLFSEKDNLENLLQNSCILNGESFLLNTLSGLRWHSLEVRDQDSHSSQSSVQPRLSLTLLDIHERKLEELKHAEAAETDPLTGLYNRRGITRELDQLKEEGFTVFFIDLDDFKPINDNYGHAIGDEVLSEVASRIRYQFHQQAVCARLGGDEFVAAVLGDGGETDSEFLCRQLINNISETIISKHGDELQVTASIGCASYPCDANSVEELMRKADSAMYMAKRRGRNRHVVYSKAMEQQLSHGQCIHQSLLRAIANERLSFKYQPIVCSQSNKELYFEAKLNWWDKNLGKVNAVEAINTLNKTGQLIPVERKICEVICADVLSLRQRYGREIRLAINISSVHFQDKEFFKRIRSYMFGFNLDVSTVVFEVSEKTLRRVQDKTPYAMQEAANKGFQFAIDGFGSGCSPILDLVSLPLQYIKLSERFKSELNNNETVLRCLVHMCQSLKIPCVASAVDTAELQQKLLGFGIALQQGDYFSPYSCLDEFVKNKAPC